MIRQESISAYVARAAGGKFLGWSALIMGAALLGACAKPAADANANAGKVDSKTAAAQPKDLQNKRAVKLSSPEVANMGIGVTAASAAQYVAETAGFGIVVNHDAIAQAVADLATAQAAARQSGAALARIERLTGTAGADTADAHEIAQRQSSSDRVALALARDKVTTVLGQKSPWSDHYNDPTLEAIAAGSRKIARVTFPLGALQAGMPQGLRVARLDAPTIELQWRAGPVWAAPADPGIPGRAFFAVLPGSDVGEGERLMVWAPTGDGASTPGVWIPAAAAIISDGMYWCYVEGESGVFERRAIDISQPLRDGYFVAQGIKAGERVVSAGAGLLLARETNPITSAD